MLRRFRCRALIWIVVVAVLLGIAAYRVLRVIGRPSAAEHPLRAASGKTTSDVRPVLGLDELRGLTAGSNLVICVLDAARVDHMGCHGYSRDTTPNIDRLASRSLVFEQHFCQYTQTKASTGSLFTSLYPDTHLGFRTGAMDRSTFTMAEGLEGGGFHTALFSSNPWASPEMGIGEHFERSVTAGPAAGRAGGGRSSGRTGAAAKRTDCRPESLLGFFEEWLDAGPPAPFAAYLHFMPPHSPYEAPEEMKEVFAGLAPPNFWRGSHPFRGITETSRAPSHEHLTPELVNLYDANFLWADWAVGEMERLLREAGVFESTLFMVTADHGETFGEHGYKWHTGCPYDEAVRIPLLIKFPGEGGPVGRVRALTQTIDLLPTIFDLYHLPYPRESIQGRSLVPLLTGEAEKVNEYIFCRTEGDPPAYVVRNSRYSLLLYEGGKRRALYDLAADPWQMRNVAGKRPEVEESLTQAFRRFALAQAAPPLHFLDPEAEAPKAPPGAQIQMTEEMREQLRSLGYVK